MAVVGIAPLLTCALLAFGALGHANIDTAMRTALAAAVLGAFVASMSGGTPIPGAARAHRAH